MFSRQKSLESFGIFCSVCVPVTLLQLISLVCIFPSASPFPIKLCWPSRPWDAPIKQDTNGLWSDWSLKKKIKKAFGGSRGLWNKSFILQLLHKKFIDWPCFAVNISAVNACRIMQYQFTEFRVKAKLED